jgi:hypothetical protein
MVTPLLDIAGLKARGVMPEVDYLTLPGPYLQSRLEIATSEIYSRLRKRYATPFVAPYPEVAIGWLIALITPELYMRRGWDPSSEQGQAILDAATRARAELVEAANEKDGLFDLPLRADTSDDGIDRGGPLGYSESNPYTSRDASRLGQ